MEERKERRRREGRLIRGMASRASRQDSRAPNSMEQIVCEEQQLIYPKSFVLIGFPAPSQLKRVTSRCQACQMRAVRIVMDVRAVRIVMALRDIQL